MIEIVKNIFKSFKRETPEIVQKQLLLKFPKALNIDWYSIGDLYEAVFYLDDVEHIAKISKEAKLIEYKKNLRESDVPEVIKLYCQNQGEIMSAIVIYSDAEIKYEIILRNTEQIRNMFLFNQSGKLLKKEAV